MKQRFILTGLLAVLCSLSGCRDFTAVPPPVEFTVGALLPLSGDQASLGEATRVALEAAVEDINVFLDEIVSGRRLRLAVEDTRTDPSVAFSALQRLAADDISVVIGPLADDELAACAAYANRVGLILISPFSAAPSLAIADDNIFRFVADDRGQAAAIAALMRDDGVTAVATLAREGIGTDELLDLSADALVADGGVVLGAVRYDPFGAGRNDYRDELTELAALIEDAVAQFGAEQVGVHLLSFEEGARVLQQAAAGDPILSTVKWYGSAGLAASPVLLADEVAAEFASTVGFAAVLPAVEETERYTFVAQRIEEALGRKPELLAIIAYDALWVAATTIQQTGNPSDMGLVAASLDDVADVYIAASGRIVLNDAGDRVAGDYDIWRVLEGDTGTAWTRTAVYSDGEIVPIEPE